MTKGFHARMFQRLGSLICLLVFTFCFRSSADSLDQWHWRNPLPQGNRLFRIVSANGTFIAVGELGAILTSTDGTNWMTRDSGTTFGLHDCAYGAGKYVIVGEYGTVLTSTNLDVWTPQYAGTFYDLNGVIYTNSQWMAVGNEGTIATSPDAAEWTMHGSGDFQLFGVTHSAGTYVAVGGRFATGSATGLGIVVTSSNGSIWSLRTVASRPFFSVTYGQGTFAAVGGFDPYAAAASVWTSTDAINWSPVASAPYFLTQITYANGKWLLGQGNLFDNGPYYLANGAIYSSENLDTFSQVVSNGPPIQGIAVANGMSVAARFDGTFLVSTDSQNWTNPLPEPLTLYLHDLKYLNGSFVGVGENTLAFSADGITWTNATPPSNTLYSITYGQGRYVAGGDYRTIWTSTDGINWSNPAPDLSEYPYLAETRVAFGNGIFVGASGYYGDLLTSPDGLNWTVQQLTNGYGYTYFEDVSYGNGRFVAVSTPLIATSTDGTNWLVIGTSNALTGVASGNGKFVAVGANVVMTSSDGTNWITQINSQFGTLTKVAFGGGFFVTVEADDSLGQPVTSAAGIWVSRDGIHWSKRDSKSARGFKTVSFGNGTFVIGGDYSVLLQSDPIVNLSLTMNGAPHLSIDGPTNRDYRLEYLSTFNGNSQWSFLTNISLSGNAGFSDVTATNFPARFYRALLLP